MEYKELSITNIPAISAVYFSLLQYKYDIYSIERDTLLIDKLRSFIIRSEERRVGKECM